MPRIQGGVPSEDLGTPSGIYQNLIQRGVSRQQAAQFVAMFQLIGVINPFLKLLPMWGGCNFLSLTGLVFPHELVKEMAVLELFFPLLSWGKTLIFSPVYLWIIFLCIRNLSGFFYTNPPWILFSCFSRFGIKSFFWSSQRNSEKSPKKDSLCICWGLSFSISSTMGYGL